MQRQNISGVDVATMIAILVLVVASRGVGLGTAASDTSSPGVAESCSQAVKQTYDSMDPATARQNALDSTLYSQNVASYHDPTFTSIYQIDKTTVPYPTCTEQVESYNVVFILHNSTGSVVDNLVITESQNLTVVGSSIQSDNPKAFSSTANNPNYEGYDAYYTGGSSDPVYIAMTLFTQPTPGYPSNSCWQGTCYVSTWVGLGNGASSSSTGFVQDGTYAYCNSRGCTNNSGAGYGGWYLTAFPCGGTCGVVFCSGLTIGGGDSIDAYSENQFYAGGHNYDYTFDITDEANSTSCYASNISTCNGGTCYITSPDHAYYITEDPLFCGSSTGDPCTLATFGTISWTDPKFYDWNSQSWEFLNTAYTAGDYVLETMINGNDSSGSCQNLTDNIVISSTPGTSGDFGTQYSSSANTPFGTPGNSHDCQ